jgi:hypothetical protein
MFLGAAGGNAMSRLPVLPLVPAVAMGIGAMCVVMLSLPLTSAMLATLLLLSDGFSGYAACGRGGRRWLRCVGEARTGPSPTLGPALAEAPVRVPERLWTCQVNRTPESSVSDDD